MFHVIPGHMIPYYHQVPMARMAREDFLSTNSQDKKQRTLCIAIFPMFQEPGHSSIATLSSLASLTREQQVPTGLPEVGSVLLASSLCAHIWCSLKYLDGTQESATLLALWGKGSFSPPAHTCCRVGSGLSLSTTDELSDISWEASSLTLLHGIVSHITG